METTTLNTQANSIYISDKAKVKVNQLMSDAGIGADASYFLRVGVVGGGCSGLSYKIDFDNEGSLWIRCLKIMGLKLLPI